MSHFYCVITNRDKLKIKKNGKVVEEKPIWHFINDQEDWLISLEYINKIQRPPGGFLFDCGAWTYKNKEKPKWTPQECIDLYLKNASPGDAITSPDHMVLKNHDENIEKDRINITLNNAKEFFKLCPAYLIPIAVTHGNDINERIEMTKALLDIGYRYIAIGGLAGRVSERKYVIKVIEETCKLRQEVDFGIHLLGVSGLTYLPIYKEFDITSYDGSSMFKNAFSAQYFWPDESKVNGLRKYSIKDLKLNDIPLCNCPACLTMREQGDDTREMGSNEKNMGRAVHNINMYLNAKKLVENNLVKNKLKTIHVKK